MCTVIVDVGRTPDEPVRMLAVRDEDPARPWHPLGAWWPERPGVVGVRDARAGGAWLAADPAARRVAVVLNRADVLEIPPHELGSRGSLVLDAVAGASVPLRPRTHGFNLVSLAPGSVRVTSWDGTELREQELSPGTHMLAHDDVDDATPRIAAWLDSFRAADPGDWLEVLAETATLEPTDDRAIIRDNRPFGYPTLSLLACVATISTEGVEVRYGALQRAGVWNTLELDGPVSA